MIKLKQNPTLIFVLILTILFELSLVFLVYQKIGADQLPMQLIRLGIQITLLLILLEKPSKILVYILTFYHVFTGLALLPSFFNVDGVGKFVVVYHVIMVFLVFFYKNIDLKLAK